MGLQKDTTFGHTKGRGCRYPGLQPAGWTGKASYVFNRLRKRDAATAAGILAVAAEIVESVRHHFVLDATGDATRSPASDHDQLANVSAERDDRGLDRLAGLHEADPPCPGRGVVDVAGSLQPGLGAYSRSRSYRSTLCVVMAGLVPAIHALLR
jgi:hypothetical protein